MPDTLTSDEVFINAVEDILNGEPNARHPVQFKDIVTVSSPWGSTGLVACTLCGSIVADTDEWTTLHRENHDLHNRIHGIIEAEARRHKPEPTYGGF